MLLKNKNYIIGHIGDGTIDGSTVSLYDYKNNTFADINAKIIKWLDHNDQETVNQAIEQNFKE